jgi:hypothetical protein
VPENGQAVLRQQTRPGRLRTWPAGSAPSSTRSPPSYPPPGPPVRVDRELRDGDDLGFGDLDTEIACFGHGEPITQDAAARLRAAAAG